MIDMRPSGPSHLFPQAVRVCAEGGSYLSFSSSVEAPGGHLLASATKGTLASPPTPSIQGKPDLPNRSDSFLCATGDKFQGGEMCEV